MGKFTPKKEKTDLKFNHKSQFYKIQKSCTFDLWQN